MWLDDSRDPEPGRVAQAAHKPSVLGVRTVAGQHLGQRPLAARINALGREVVHPAGRLPADGIKLGGAEGSSGRAGDTAQCRSASVLSHTVCTS